MPGFSIDSTPEYCHQSIEKSLARLGLPFVDLFYVHRLDKVTPIEKTMAAMVELKNAGKIKHIGLSECSANSLRRAYAVHPVTCVQVEYSPFCKDIESATRMLEVARGLDVAIVAYSPLGNGFLGGNIRSREDVSKPGDFRGHLPWLSDENLDKTWLFLIESLIWRAPRVLLRHSWLLRGCLRRVMISFRFRGLRRFLVWRRISRVSL